MIWLSALNGAEGYSSYFDVRELDIRCRNRTCSGLVSGIVGVGSLEFWGDIRIGQEDSVQLLPICSDDGMVETIPDGVDQQQLQRELLAEVRDLLQGLENSELAPAPRRWHSGGAENIQKDCCLAA